MKKTITFFINDLNAGGTEKHLLNLVNYLSKYFKINVFAFRGGDLEQDFKMLPIKIFIPKFRIFSFFSCFFYIKNLNSDILHFFLPKSYLVAGIISIFKKSLRVMSRRSQNFYHKKYLYLSYLFETFLHKFTDKILVNSKSIFKQIQSEFVPQNKIILINNGVRVPKIKKIKKGSKVVKVGLIANLIPYKGHQKIIEIVSKLKDEDFIVYFIGCDYRNYKKKIEKLIKKKELENRFFFSGYIVDIYSKIAELDIIINASSEEGQSNALIEALALGKPLIGFDVGGNSEIIKDKFNGFIIKYNDLENYSQMLKKIINNKSLRMKFGKNSTEYYKKKFQLDISHSSYLGFYTKLLTQGKTSK